MARIVFTTHAKEKFALLRMFGFELSEREVIRAINEPDRVDRRGQQSFSMKIIDKEYALRVVHEERKTIIVVVTFYPVRRERFGL